MKTPAVNLKTIRAAAARKNIFSVAHLARELGCSRWAIYHLHKCPGLWKKIRKTYDLKKPHSDV